MFETPLYLIAAGVGALIPLMLHLLRSKKVVTVPFPTVRFLQLAQRASSRRIRLEHILLWILRTVIMLLIGIAFAMPVLRSHGFRFMGRTPRDIAIVLDMSYSMGYQTGRDTLWDRALELAGDLIRQLEDRDRYALFVARQEPRALIAEPIHEQELGLGQLSGLRLGHDTSRLLPALDAAYNALRDVPMRRQREIHVITDNQRVPWDGLDEAPDFLDALRDDALSTLFVSLLGVTAPENITPVDVTLTPAVQFAGGGGRLSVALGHTGPPRETTVTVYINDREIARRSVMTGTSQASQLEFQLPPLPAGIHAGRVQVPADNLPVDDAFHFLVRVQDEWPVLVVGDEADTFFLRTALRAAGSDGFSVTWWRQGEWEPDTLHSFAALFLCNALPLPGQQVEAIERFVQRGGVLVIFPGLRAAPEDYRAWRSLPGLPDDVVDVPRLQSRRNLIWAEPGHPVLRGLAETVGAPVIALQRHLAWTSLADDAVPLILLGEAQPLLIERPYGLGRVALFAVGADRGWSNLPLTPFYLPLIAQFVEYSAGIDARPPHLWSRPLMPLDLLHPDPGAELSIIGPDGIPMPIRSIRQNGDTVNYVERMTAPGIYLRDTGQERRPLAAINMPRAESDLTPIDPETLKERLNLPRLHIATDADELAALLEEHRVGRAFGEWLLWALLALIPLEFIYANALARSRGLPGGPITVDMSGRVHRPAAVRAGGGS